jgi:hypothetical protein
MAVAEPNALEAFMTESAASSEAVADGLHNTANEPVVASGEPGVGELTYTLLVPLTVNGERLTRVTLRLADLGDIDDWGSGKLPTNRDLLARLTGLHPVVLRSLKWPDAEAVIKLFEAAVPAFVIQEIGKPQ